VLLVSAVLDVSAEIVPEDLGSSYEVSPKRALIPCKITESKMPRTCRQDTCRERTPRHGGEEFFGKQYGDGAFHPGEARDERLPVQPALTNYQAVINVVTYIDGTADASVNSAGLERIVEERKASVDSKKMATAIIKTALADPNDTNV
jgi:hypothetical protein